MSPAHRADDVMNVVFEFMPPFMLHLNPVLHRTRYHDRSYSELEVIVVLALALLGPLRPGKVSHDLRIEKGSLTSVIRRLTDLGMIERQPAAGDARGYTMSLTDGGRALVDHLERQRRDGFRELFDDMPTSEVEAVVNGIAALTNHLTKREGDHAQGD